MSFPSFCKFVEVISQTSDKLKKLNMRKDMQELKIGTYCIKLVRKVN